MLTLRRTFPSVFTPLISPSLRVTSAVSFSAGHLFCT
jgi:hypothetical protein